MDLPTVWFFLIGVLLMGYAILDGFDLGVGMLHLLVKRDRDRRLILNSIGPLWDGNEVWLVTFGGALFAAFPDAYAVLLSSFYLPVMVILLGLIGRAISLEFRSKSRKVLWRRYWDVSFFLSSLTTTFVFGVALGNVVAGIDVGPTGLYQGSVFDLLAPFPLATGLLAVTGAAMHGAIYLYLKTENGLQQRAQRWIWYAYFAFLAAYALVTVLAFTTVPHATANFEHLPAAWIVVGLNVLAIANIPRAIHQNRPVYAFISSCCTIAALTFLVAMALFPNLVISTIDPRWNIDIDNGSSSESTLQLMGVIALIGLPLVATYTSVVYWVFRGKVQLGTNSY
jgi:cytochrome d ubiquinol oxidase subunit II